MKKIFYYVCIFVIFCVVSCGPSPEAIATMTASVWTPTPEPTLTPTPMPFDLEVMLQDEDGNPITFEAYVGATEFKPALVDEAGMIEILNMPVPQVEVIAKAQGYLEYTEAVTLEHGKNSVTITMAADPTQIDPATACDEGQTLLYIEDFEDGFAEDWTEGLNRPMWVYEDIDGRGKAVTFTGEVEGGFGTMITDRRDYGNIVWKFDFKGGDTHLFLHGFEGEPLKYRIVMQPYKEGIVIIHEEEGVHQSAAQRIYRGEDWAKAAVAYFNGSTEFWIDDELFVALDDPNPIETGPLGFLTSHEGAPFSLDNIVICEIAEPYVAPIVEVMEEEG